MKPYILVTYVHSGLQVVIRRATETEPEAPIPVDPDNGDYKAYLAWVAAGNEPDVEERP